MSDRIFVRFLVYGLCLLGCSGGLFAQEKPEPKIIDGTVHVLNAAQPLKGQFPLEIEPVLTIDPYEHPEVGLPSIWFCRAADGNVILYSLNKIEAHRFSPDGKYLGPLGRKGQGPGEFPQAFNAAFFDGSICGFTTTKMIQFDLEGRFVRETALKIRPDWIVGADRYLNVTQVPDGNDHTSILHLVRFNPAKSGEEGVTELLKGRNLGAIKKPGSAAGFAGERWGTPNFATASDPLEKRIYTALNTEYKIEVRDDLGKTIFVIERPYRNVRVSKDDVEFLFRSQFEAYGYKPNDPNHRWIREEYPSHLVAIRALFPLPKGHLAVYRVTKPMEFEIDVFDREGNYLYALIPPPEIRMFNIQYHRTGFSVIEPQDDLYVYREYRVKNLPEVFQ